MFMNKKKNNTTTRPVSYTHLDVYKRQLFGRGIDYEIINYCLQKGFLFESLPYHNAVFVGFDANGQAKMCIRDSTDCTSIWSKQTTSTLPMKG